MLILKYALNHSKFIRNSDYVIKITGRLIIPNLIESLHMTNLLWPFKREKLYFSVINKNERLIDSRCFISNKPFIERLISNGNTLNDTEGYYFEHMLFDVVSGLKSQQDICLFYPTLTFLGISGSTGVEYKSAEKTFFQTILNLREYCQIQKKRENLSLLRYFYLSIISGFVRIIKAIVRRVM